MLHETTFYVELIDGHQRFCGVEKNTLKLRTEPPLDMTGMKKWRGTEWFSAKWTLFLGHLTWTGHSAGFCPTWMQPTVLVQVKSCSNVVVNVMGLAEEEGGVRVVFQGSHCLETGWTSICLWQLVSLCITCPPSSFLSLIKPSVSQSMTFFSFTLPNLSPIPLCMGREWAAMWVITCWLWSTHDSEYQPKRLAKNSWEIFCLGHLWIMQCCI